ncbi:MULTISPECIES: DUF1289 domain-containing protein [Methylobacteriaceae]|uniref:DUF1289 domain-containing protein n=3 Tax=Methylorubrum TaxID=2282523 RepID=C5ASF0_METEA|nr:MULTISPECIES: DUF1289 domain-containing protein [Methylobacteriaceae]ACS40391.1 conserved hypothetical protein [Methylorubrum extorquens AM1]MBD8905345.1 DUF1289 domain-containing protein [Methylorubrum zatmanii]MDV2986589.1 DUF1289 domain-containing protein [Methylobacteriaceae bacterium AG10]UMY19536.1 DUF1289 domain-containing protein [Methylobacterium organophilum]
MSSEKPVAGEGGRAVTEKDPCTGVCRFDGRSGWCVGCGRTSSEIRAWRKMTPCRRTALARELPRRVRQASGEGAAP